ncbi:MAG: AmmeMemoRadiSam system radical SAM enzyme [Elusimicrobiota bacterium]
MVPWEGVSSLAPDPVEKKPLYHFLPGAKTLSFGTLGCNFSCSYCQNYSISVPQDNSIWREFSALELAELAVKENVRVMVATYNEPTVSLEWALEIFKKGRQLLPDMKVGLVSNGYLSIEAIELLSGIDFIKIDLKSFDRNKFAELTGASLQGVLDCIKDTVKRGFWIELVTPLVPGFNDSQKEIEEAAYFILSIDSELPWHITAFRPAYRMRNRAASEQDVRRAVMIARSCGLKYVYGGNVFAPDLLATFCPGCGKKVLEREALLMVKNHLLPGGKCPCCSKTIRGVWE